MSTNTIQLISELTDAGLFERLATAVLRLADQRYASLAHPGVNTDGRTVRSPVDGIAFVPGATPAHMIAVHHTICGRDQLQAKWLHDPSTVRPRTKGARPTQPAGDVVKTLEIFKQQAERQPGLKGMLVLTTPQEPSEILVRDVNAYVHGTSLAVDIWSGSRLSQFLDTNASGQWIRRQFLGVLEEQLSPRLLLDLSRKSIELQFLHTDDECWVDRRLDRELAEIASQDLTFVIAESGLGKTVACLKQLSNHIDAGGYGLVLPHEAVESALSLDNALESVLRQLQPSLAPGCGTAARTICSASQPLMLVVEDVNKSGRGALLIEKLAGWREFGEKERKFTPWRILCPVWPQLIASLGQGAQKRISSAALWANSFDFDEGAKAVAIRRARSGTNTTNLEAASISSALGHDPLLIALHDPSSPLEPLRVLESFIETSARKLAVQGDVTASEIRDALRALTSAMMRHRVLDPDWMTLQRWGQLTADQISALRKVASQGEVIRLVGPDDTVSFRHDRVRAFLLTDAAAQMLKEGTLEDDLLADPYFAEIMGGAIAKAELTAEDVQRIEGMNILALFFALRSFTEPLNDSCQYIVERLRSWLTTEGGNSRSHQHLRWEVLLALEETDSPQASELCTLLKDDAWISSRVKLRHGDLRAGINYCLNAEPGVRILGQEQMFDHVCARHGDKLVGGLNAFLQTREVTTKARIGALRLAGHLGDPRLAAGLAASWTVDEHRENYLGEYLFACAECAGEDPASLLDPICDAWAMLPGKREDGHRSARDELAADNIRWAFQRRLPLPSLRYFMERAKEPELRWPITYVLHAIDHPEAVEFTAKELAARAGSNGPFFMSMFHEWTRRQEETGATLSEPSKRRLQKLWQDANIDEPIRVQAFRLWNLTTAPDDLGLLREIPETDVLSEKAIWQRLRRGDHSAIPMMLLKFHEKNPDFWWQLGRGIWSDALTQELDRILAARPEADEWDDHDWMLSEMIMRLSVDVAEDMLVRHWRRIRRSSRYIHAALYVATPRLRALVAESVAECPDPAVLFQFLIMHFGHKTRGHPGIRSLAQMEAIAPYFGHLKAMDISDLWEVCNDRGWYAFRKSNLDSRLPPDGRGAVFLEEAKINKNLNEKLSDYPQVSMGHWVNDFISTGASVDTVMTALGTWVAAQNSPNALELFSEALANSGKRYHVSLLGNATLICSDVRANISTDTTFAVKRRSLQ